MVEENRGASTTIEFDLAIGLSAFVVWTYVDVYRKRRNRHVTSTRSHNNYRPSRGKSG